VGHRSVRVGGCHGVNPAESPRSTQKCCAADTSPLRRRILQQAPEADEFASLVAEGLRLTWK